MQLRYIMINIYKLPIYRCLVGPADSILSGMSVLWCAVAALLISSTSETYKSKRYEARNVKFMQHIKVETNELTYKFYNCILSLHFALNAMQCKLTLFKSTQLEREPQINI